MELIIETERLILRPLTANDAEDVFEWCSDPEVNRFVPYLLYHDVEDVRRWIESIQTKEYEFGFELKETGKVIGAGSVCYRAEEDAYEIGYNLSRAFWNRGYATEAAKGMIDWTNTTFGARSFYAVHAAANEASCRVLCKLGFKEDHTVQYSKIDGSETFDAVFRRLYIE